jgi:multidrug efflux pump
VSLSEISIRRPVFAWMLMAAIILFGVLSFKKLGISQFPDVNFPVVSVSLSLNGAAPEVMESQVLDPLEDSIMQIDGIRSVTSSAQQSSASIAVEFELNQDINKAMQAVENHINQVLNLLPKDLQPPIVRKTNPEDQPILWVALTSDDPKTKPIDMMIYARNYLYDQLGVLPGVGDIALGGYVAPALRVWVNNNKLHHFNLTSDDLITAIETEHIEVPAGTIQNAKNEYGIRFLGEAKSPQEFGEIRVQNRAAQGPNFRPTPLKDLGEIEEGLADVRKISRFNGLRAIGLGIIKQHGANAVEVAEAVKTKIAALQSELPPHFQVSVRSDNTRFIKQSVNELMFALSLSAILTSIVCYLFLGSWTSTMNILMAIPTSIIGAFTALYFFGFTLNAFTLLGLSLAIGIVVDDAIMMLENIVRHRQMGQGKVTAAINGSREITFASLAATLAIAAIFLPVVFMKGIIGRYFLQYGITVTVAVFLSLLEALTLTPMRCSRYLRVSDHETGLAGFVERLFHRLAVSYEKLLQVLLRHRWKTVIIATLVFFASILLARILPWEMMPSQDQSMFLLRFKLPVGTALDVTNDKIKQVENYLLKIPEINGVYSAVGGFGGDAVNQANAFATMVDQNKRHVTQQQMINRVRRDLKKMFPEMQTIVQDLSLRGFASTRGFPVEFIIQGPDWDQLTQITNGLMDKIRESGKATDVNTDVQGGMPELQLTPDRKKLAQHGVTVNTVTKVLNALVGGQVFTRTAEYTKGNHRYEVELRLVADERTKKPDLNLIELRNSFGETVALPKLVNQEVKPSLMLISRLNRARAITVYANPTSGHSQEEVLKYIEGLAHKTLPPGYTIKMVGSSQSFRESFVSLVYAMILGIVVSYMVLASQFNSFLHPFTVLLALPFSISGAFLGLLVFHQSINIYSLIGFILLMGIVKKNSILLVDFTNQVRREGDSVDEALLKACPIRLRPILMTSLATVAAAIPEAFAVGPGSETTIPMAVAIIGGVVASTTLTLFVVPCFYSLASRLEGSQQDPQAPRPI